MWRELAPILAVGLPIVAGLALVYLFVSDVIGVATLLAVAFALCAFALTTWVLHGAIEDDADVQGPLNL
jgi:hypothetical protein